MAIKSTVFNLDLSIADVNRNYYQDHHLTLARHPSETDVRMLVRIAVFAFNASDELKFTKGLANVDEPDLWQIDLTGAIRHWIDLGQPQIKRIRQSCSKATHVDIYTYQSASSMHWFEAIKSETERFAHLAITHLHVVDERMIPALVERTMHLNCLIQDQQLLLSSATESVEILSTVRQRRRPRY